MKNKKKIKDPNQFPNDGLLVKNRRIIVGKCCRCGLRHAWYFEVFRAKKEINDGVYIQCEVIKDNLTPQ